MIRYQDERADRVDALRTRYLAGEFSATVFSASLHGVGGMTGEDIRHELGNYAPPAPGQAFEERRMEASRLWLKNYRNC